LWEFSFLWSSIKAEAVHCKMPLANGDVLVTWCVTTQAILWFNLYIIVFFVSVYIIIIHKFITALATPTFENCSIHCTRMHINRCIIGTLAAIKKYNKILTVVRSYCVIQFSFTMTCCWRASIYICISYVWLLGSNSGVPSNDVIKSCSPGAYSGFFAMYVIFIITCCFTDLRNAFIIQSCGNLYHFLCLSVSLSYYLNMNMIFLWNTEAVLPSVGNVASCFVAVFRDVVSICDSISLGVRGKFTTSSTIILLIKFWASQNWQFITAALFQ